MRKFLTILNAILRDKQPFHRVANAYIFHAFQLNKKQQLPLTFKAVVAKCWVYFPVHAVFDSVSVPYANCESAVNLLILASIYYEWHCWQILELKKDSLS